MIVHCDSFPFRKSRIVTSLHERAAPSYEVVDLCKKNVSDLILRDLPHATLPDDSTHVRFEDTELLSRLRNM